MWSCGLTASHPIVCRLDSFPILFPFLNARIDSYILQTTGAVLQEVCYYGRLLLLNVDSSFLSHSQEEIRSWSRRAPHAAFPLRPGPHRRADTQFVAGEVQPWR